MKVTDQMLTKELHQRLEHGYKRFQSLVPWQETAYLIKEEQARRVIKGDTSDIGFIQDEAQFRKLPLETIANLVIAKADNLNICPHCSKRNIDAKAKYCSDCGENLT